MRNVTVLELADHLEKNVSDRDFQMQDHRHCILGHLNQLAGHEAELTEWGDKKYFEPANTVFGDVTKATEIFFARGLYLKKKKLSLFDKVLLWVGHPVELFEEVPKKWLDEITRDEAVDMLRRFDKTGEVIWVVE